MASGSKLHHAGIAVAFAVMVIIARLYPTQLQKTRPPPLVLDQLAIFDRIIPAAPRLRFGLVFHRQPVAGARILVAFHHCV
jgi:hypothetical protein